MKKIISIYITEIKNVVNKGLLHLFTANGLIYIVGFASTLFVAGILDPADIGRIKIMQTYVGLASLIGGFGFNTSLLKLVSDKNSEYDKVKLFNLCLVISFFSFIFLYGILFILNSFGIISNDTEITKLFPFYTISLLPLILQSMQLAYYQAIKEIKKMALLQLIVKFVSVVLIILVTYFYKLNGYVIIIPVVGIFSVFILDRGLKLSVFKRVKKGIDWSYFHPLWSFASFAFLANLFGTILNTLDVYFINFFVKDKTQIGYYMFALTILSVYQLFPSSVQQVAFPFFSEKSADRKNWLNVYKKYNRINHIFITLVVIAGLLIIPPLIKLAFSGKYDQSIYFFIILSISWLFKSLNIMKGTALMGYGKFNLNFHASLISTIILLPVMFLLIYYYGLKGALIAKIISGIVIYFTSAIIFKRFVNSKFN